MKLVCGPNENEIRSCVFKYVGGVLSSTYVRTVLGSPLRQPAPEQEASQRLGELALENHRRPGLSLLSPLPPQAAQLAPRDALNGDRRCRPLGSLLHNKCCRVNLFMHAHTHIYMCILRIIYIYVCRTHPVFSQYWTTVGRKQESCKRAWTKVLNIRQGRAQGLSRRVPCSLATRGRRSPAS